MNIESTKMIHAITLSQSSYLGHNNKQYFKKAFRENKIQSIGFTGTDFLPYHRSIVKIAGGISSLFYGSITTGGVYLGKMFLTDVAHKTLDVSNLPIATIDIAGVVVAAGIIVKSASPLSKALRAMFTGKYVN